MLTVDNREPPELQRLLAKYCKKDSLVVAKMIAGDFRIDHGEYALLIERKTVSDLLSTWVTTELDAEDRPISRLRRQLHACRDGATEAALLVEGEYQEDQTTGYIITGSRLRQIKYQSLARLLWDLQDEGIKLIHTYTRDQTAQQVVALYESLRRHDGTGKV